MAKLPKTDQRKKSTKLIDKLCAINLMKANMNSKTNNPNYSKVKSLSGVDRKTLASWWQKREEIEKQTHKRGRSNIKSPKFRGKYPEMEDILDMRMCINRGAKRPIPGKMRMRIFWTPRKCACG